MTQKNEEWRCFCGQVNEADNEECCACGRAKPVVLLTPKIGDGHEEEIETQRDYGLDPIE